MSAPSTDQGVCVGCGAGLEPSRRGPSRTWCSPRCRKRVLYGQPCLDCGTRTSGTAGLKAEPLCPGCSTARRNTRYREWVIESLREWDRLFGRPPTARDWNQSQARAQAATWLVKRHEATGREWPSATGVQHAFGSWNAAIKVAGFEALTRRRRRSA